MALDKVEELILKLLRENKTTVEVAKILNEKGFRTIKGDIFIRKTVNNKILSIRNRGLFPTSLKVKASEVEVIPEIFAPEIEVVPEVQAPEVKPEIKIEVKQEVVEPEAQPEVVPEKLVEVPNKRKYVRLTPVKPYIFEVKSGKFRVRKYANGYVHSKTFSSVAEADKYLAKLDKDLKKDEVLPQLSSLNPPELQKEKQVPRITNIPMPQFFSPPPQSKDSSFIVMLIKDIAQLPAIFAAWNGEN